MTLWVNFGRFLGVARLARLVVRGLPHHIIQRGNRRQQTLFFDEDCVAYLELMAEWCGERGVEVRAYCLMPPFFSSYQCQQCNVSIIL